jgi:hypothetical protein
VIRALLEMVIDAERRAREGDEHSKEMKELLLKALDSKIVNSVVAQSGTGNAALIGDGTQTVQPVPPRPDGRK